MYNCLKALDIPCTLILDSAVGYIMERVNMVMVGAECVVESGGIINKVIHYHIYFHSNKIVDEWYFYYREKTIWFFILLSYWI